MKRLALVVSVIICWVVEALLLLSMPFFGVNEYNLIPFLCLLGPTIGLTIGLFVTGGTEPSNYKDVINYLNLNKLGRGKW